MVGVGFQETLGDDQGDKHQGDERLGDSFSGGGFHSNWDSLLRSVRIRASRTMQCLAWR